jgi:hypothetical protein
MEPRTTAAASGAAIPLVHPPLPCSFRAVGILRISEAVRAAKEAAA